MTHQRIQKDREKKTLGKKTLGQKKENSMTCMVLIAILVVGGVLGDPSSLANLPLLSDYPGYQMGVAVTPEFGSPGANDPGQPGFDVSPVPRETSAYQDVDPVNAINAVVDFPSRLESRGEGVLLKVKVHPDRNIVPHSSGRYISPQSRREECEISHPMERKRWRV